MGREKLIVQARIPNDTGPAEEGLLSSIDNAIDNSTGTILLKGMFLNKAQRLWPGQFVNLTLILDIQPDAVLVPSRAIQTGQRGQYVFVVRSDLTVESRPITVDRTVGEESIVGQGLKPGETVVIEGQLQLVPGRKVGVKNSAHTGISENNQK